MSGDEQMIAAAERIGAEQGLAAMSLRSVQAAAGQRNKSAAQYHFGSREGLIDAVVRTRMAPINERRTQMLLAIDGPGSIRELVDVLVRPPAEAVLGGEASFWARFVVQGFADPTMAETVRSGIEGEAYRSVCLRLLDRLDHVPAALRRHRLEQVVGLLFLTLAAGEEAISRGASPPVDLATMVAELVNVCIAVFEAPAPDLIPPAPTVAVKPSRRPARSPR